MFKEETDTGLKRSNTKLWAAILLPKNKHPLVTSPMTKLFIIFFCKYWVFFKLLCYTQVFDSMKNLWGFPRFSVWSEQWDNHFLCFSLKNVGAFFSTTSSETMQMFLKGGKTFILQHFDLKCGLNLTKIVVYVFFLFSFVFARMARDTEYALSSRCNSYFLREATNTHADTKKNLQKNPTALLLDVSRNTQ